MQTLKLIGYILILTSFCLISCKRYKGDIITKRIQYDVLIKSTDDASAWYVQNIEGASRESFVSDIISLSKQKHIKLYDVISLKEIDKDEAEKRGRNTNYITLQRPYKPYENYDTTIIEDLNIQKITKMRFLEEWYFDKKKNLIIKKVIAVCPMLESYNEAGALRGYLPLYWISLSEEFSLKNK